MRRPQDGRELVALGTDECWKRLSAAPVARIAYVAQGRPHVVPVNHAVQEHTIYVRTMSGLQLTNTLADLGAKVAVEADGLDHDSRLGWSVLADGAMYPVLDRAVTLELAKAARQSWSLADPGTWLSVRVDRISGRRLVHVDRR